MTQTVPNKGIAAAPNNRKYKIVIYLIVGLKIVIH